VAQGRAHFPEHYTIIAPDLRGYGDSGKPPGRADHVNYSKRAMAQDMMEVMASLSFNRFAMLRAPPRSTSACDTGYH
jgi:pimeloyl-ACP methyl ester carboxylesterase